MSRLALVHQRIVELSPTGIAAWLLLTYASLAVVCGVLYWALSRSGIGAVSAADGSRASVGDTLYFSFVTQLTIGYGDLIPSGAARFVAVAQAMAGTGLFGIWVAYLILRITSADPRTLMFSPRAIYFRNEGCFGVLLVNTTGRMVTDVEIRAVAKVHRRHTHPEISQLPYLRDSALLVRVVHGDLLAPSSPTRAEYDPDDDGLKVSVRCQLVAGQYGAGRKYSFREILVVDSDAFMDVPEFRTPNLGSDDFWKLFANPSPSARTLHDTLSAA